MESNGRVREGGEGEDEGEGVRGQGGGGVCCSFLKGRAGARARTLLAAQQRWGEEGRTREAGQALE